MLTVSPQNYNSTWLGNQPCEGWNAVRVPLAFDGVDGIEVDLSIVQQTGHFSAAQTLYVDNSTNSVPIFVQCEQSNQTFQVPAGGFIYMPLIQPNPPKVIFNSSNAVNITAFFLNFFLPPCVWGPLVTGGSGLLTTENPNDHSGTIAVGGTAQLVIPANTNRKGFLISNPDTATETLYIMLGAAANGRIPLVPGATYESGNPFWAGGVYLVAATGGHAFTAYEGT